MRDDTGVSDEGMSIRSMILVEPAVLILLYNPVPVPALIHGTQPTRSAKYKLQLDQAVFTNEFRRADCNVSSACVGFSEKIELKPATTLFRSHTYK